MSIIAIYDRVGFLQTKGHPYYGTKAPRPTKTVHVFNAEMVQETVEKNIVKL